MSTNITGVFTGYPDTRRVTYGDDNAQFVPVCPKCGRYVKADKTIVTHGCDNEVREDEPNATCARCGRVAMPFEGYF